mmetsp:Transcript_92/g.285  ORF Transcript_92/g.285 Transcript_92/m.285 type:complete len:270 (-) Transcript_92:219-1028(-)
MVAVESLESSYDLGPRSLVNSVFLELAPGVKVSSTAKLPTKGTGYEVGALLQNDKVTLSSVFDTADQRGAVTLTTQLGSNLVVGCEDVLPLRWKPKLAARGSWGMGSFTDSKLTIERDMATHTTSVDISAEAPSAVLSAALHPRLVAKAKLTQRPGPFRLVVEADTQRQLALGFKANIMGKTHTISSEASRSIDENDKMSNMRHVLKYKLRSGFVKLVTEYAYKGNEVAIFGEVKNKHKDQGSLTAIFTVPLAKGGQPTGMLAKRWSFK